ncbi:MAG: hypothetical protein QOC80_1943 [Frankiaceae bacterium]|nr:hypothetical protein [Frankiaceae bacterium]MDQ1674327.1 hypothetical protein [Frankiaceae bacterium]
MTDLELPPSLTAVDPLELYAGALDGTALYRRFADGRLVPVPTRQWTGGLRPGDESLLARCPGSTLDVGCGPGRLTVALQQRGRAALGIDISPRALTLARAAGAQVLARDVFGDVPGVGGWTRLLLADGNVGIGGDVGRLLSRCAELLRPGGVVFLELPAAPTAALGISGDDTAIRLEDAAGRVSSWFRWSEPDAAGVRRAAAGTGLRQVAAWTAAGRSFLGLATRLGTTGS